MSPIVVTGLGVLAPTGIGCDAFAESLAAGRHAIGPFTRFADATPCLAATLPPPWDDPALWARAGAGPDPLAAVALVAAREAWSHARLDDVAPERIGLVLGTSSGGIISRSRFELGDNTPDERARLLEQSRADVQTALVARGLGVAGPRLTVSTACTSATHAIAIARELIAAGAADVVLAGGADLLAAEIVSGFDAMGVIGPGPCAAFSSPAGLTLGEGAAFVVLEDEAAARARGVAVIARLCGTGASADGWHATAPDPTGAGLARALEAALDDAGVSADDIGYVSAHGTGTEANDAAECRAIARVFGAQSPPVSSLKGHFGHARGAAGALELVATLLCLTRGVVPPTLHFNEPRPGAAPPDPIAQPRPRPHHYMYGAKLSAAFGGSNAALVFATADAAKGLASPRRKRVAVIGVGVAGSADVPRGIDARGFDGVTRALTAAAARAVGAAGPALSAAARERTGVVVGANRLPSDTAHELWQSIRARGFDKVSVPAFSRLVLNAAAGAMARALGLRGPLTVLAAGSAGALRSVVLARWLLLGDATPIAT